MCGIAGIVGQGAAASAGALDRMRVSLQHRGPDDAGDWFSPSGLAAFAHTRLAVIDTTAAGHQPMTVDDGRLSISFNGEIYNFRALRRELEGKGVRFTTNSDTEVILRLYDAHGDALVSRLRGMFAFALWDERDRSCLLARDPLGLKPLYFSCGGDGRLVFASEVRAMQASKLVSAELSAAGVYGYLRSGSVPEPDTILEKVKSLEAGQLAVWRNGQLTTRRYWTLRFAADASTNHHDEAVRAALADAVDHHFVSDVPVGVLLSGGVDSSAMLALAAASGRTVQTFSMTFPGDALDEGPAARRTAERFQASHTECAINGLQARDLLPHFLAAADQPSIDGFNTFVVAKAVHEHGVKVALSGVGADELFGGYPSFDRVPQMAAWNHHLSWTGPVRTMGGRLLERVSRAPRWRRVGDLLQQPPSLQNSYTTFRAIYTRGEARTLMAGYGLTPPENLDGAAGPAIAGSERDEVSRLELTRYVRNQLLRESDVASMAWGVELRAPFLDVTLIETLARIPAAARLGAAKPLLRASVPEVPAWVDGRKRCFQFPFESWIAGDWRSVFTGVEARSPVPTGPWYRKWCLFVLDHWLTRSGAHGC